MTACSDSSIGTEVTGGSDVEDVDDLTLGLQRRFVEEAVGEGERLARPVELDLRPLLHLRRQEHALVALHLLGHRLGQARHLAEDLARSRTLGRDKRPLPLLIAGDLNAPEASPVVQTLLALGLRDAWSSAGSGWGYTHGHSLRPHLSFLRIDHVLVSPTLGLAEVAVGGSEASEHRPVIADVWLNRN